MANDLAICRENLLKCVSYGGNEHFHSSFTWHSEKIRHVLVHEASKANTILAVVRQVLKKDLDCTTSGNFHMHNFETLQKAKFQLLGENHMHHLRRRL